MSGLSKCTLLLLLFISSFECNGKVYAIATMKMVFLNENYRSVTGKEALIVRSIIHMPIVVNITKPDSK